MDVLYLIKEDHKKIRTLLKTLTENLSGRFVPNSLSELKFEIFSHLTIEEKYLYPELTGLLGNSDRLIASLIANHNQISSAFKKLQRNFVTTSSFCKQTVKEKTECLSSIINGHFQAEEEMLLPKIRELFPTQDREDLGQVFLDVREELRKETLVSIEKDQKNIVKNARNSKEKTANI